MPALPLNTTRLTVDHSSSVVDSGPAPSFGYNGVSRETIYATLASKFQSVMGLGAMFRDRYNITGMNANLSPIGFLMQMHSKAVRTKMAPTRYLDTAVLTIGVAQNSGDPNLVAATVLNNLRDLLDQALMRDSPDLWTCTLGGIVDYCRPVQDIYAETLQNDIWTSFTTTIEFLYTPINFL